MPAKVRDIPSLATPECSGDTREAVDVPSLETFKTKRAQDSQVQQ